MGRYRWKRTTLGRAFPSSDPLSQAILRLSILREDLHFEVRALSNRRAAVLTKPDPWLARSYFVRRITVSLAAIHEVLMRDRALNDFIAAPPRGVDRDAVIEAKAQRKMLARNMQTLEPIRHKLAAHMDREFAQSILEEHAALEGPLQVSMERVTDTVLSLPMHAAVVGCFGKPRDGQTPEGNSLAFLGKLRAAHDAAIMCADCLVVAFMQKHGLWG